ncbi:MAG TPA: UDP-N-acetylmuramoyl-L-alanyl-D-glutamate--2,6-diaminopimelate ligase [Candidatus Omnitrophica bacterium]|nr:UDP-N-acetylmuramoyl-L-alanyl-D-glutamate--2,6-diaminopimelate ligase [Candidatus Omnitrophota bacterium]
MKLKKLLNGIGIEKVKGEKNLNIKGIASDSREVNPEYLFVACRGSSKDGHDFVLDAVRRGATALLVEKALDFRVNGTTYIKVPDTLKALAKVVDNFYGNPTYDLEVVGITGTNGKTTTSYLIEEMLENQGYKSGRIGTVNYSWGERTIPSSFTTPPPPLLYSLITKMKTERVKALVMEVSSHALSQKRVDAIQFNSCIFTNISRDHLDYHSTFSNYIRAKKRLMELLTSSIKRDKFIVLNGDDKVLRKFATSPLPHLFYGFNRDNDVCASEVHCNWRRVKFHLTSPWYNGKIEVPLVGSFNVYNILAIISWAGMRGFSMDMILDTLKKTKHIPGRFQVFRKNGSIAVVDYAHSPDALERVIQTAKELTKGNVITVFGCGGERDRGKRPIMGRISSEMSDYTIVTSDNPRSEDPLTIIEDIKKGLASGRWIVEPNRRRAIQMGIKMLKRGDTLLVAGKGHENYQILKDTVVPFNDIEIIEEYFEV